MFHSFFKIPSKNVEIGEKIEMIHMDSKKYKNSFATKRKGNLIIISTIFFTIC